jgi:hypothetical protein
MNVEEIFEALSEGRISFNEAVQLLMQAGFSGELRSVPMFVERRPQEKRVVVIREGVKVGQGKLPTFKDMQERKGINYCDICKVYFADANKDLQMLVGKKLCSECVKEVIAKLQNKGNEPTIGEMNAEFVKTEKPIEIRKKRKEELKNESGTV